LEFKNVPNTTTRLRSTVTIANVRYRNLEGFSSLNGIDAITTTVLIKTETIKTKTPLTMFINTNS